MAPVDDGCWVSEWESESAFLSLSHSETLRLNQGCCWGLAALSEVMSVSYRRMVRLIYAGWLPQGEVFGWRGAAGLEIGRRIPRLRVVLLIVVKRVTPHVRRHLVGTASGLWGYSSMTANDQHQPAS